MKKLFCILLAIMLLVSFVGCDTQGNPTESSIPETSSPENISPFTDEFFSDVVRIDIPRFGYVTGEQMKPVIQYLQGLTLTATDRVLSGVNEEGEILWGAMHALIFTNNKGEKIEFSWDDELIVYESEVRVTYLVVGGNFGDGLKESLRQGLQSGGEENAN